jgi:hypothetical protein
MPHPVVAGQDDEEDCTDSQAFLSTEGNVFVQPYNKTALPFRVRHALQEHDGMWIKIKRVKPWKNTPTELGVLPVDFMETFHIAKMETPGSLPLAALDRGTLLKEKYLVHSRKGSVVRDGALREEEYDEQERNEEEQVLEEETVVMTAFEEKVPAQYEATQQEPNTSAKVETSAKLESKKSSCVVM